MKTVSPQQARSRRLPIDAVIAAVLLLCILVGIIIFSALESGKIASETEALNIAGRQRMLTERQAKLLYRVGVGYTENNPIDMAESVRDLKRANKIFGDTLKAFSIGGETAAVNDSKERVTLDPVGGTDLRREIERLQDLWRDYSVEIAPLLTTRLSKIDESIIIRAAEATREVNEPLLESASNFTTALQRKLDNHLSRLQAAQLGSAAAILLLLGWITFRVIRNLSRNSSELSKNLNELAVSNRELEATQATLAQNSHDLQAAYESLSGYSTQIEETSRQLRTSQEESETIFSAVGEGLCLIGPDYRIGNQVSDEMFEIFETDTLTGRSLVDLLRPLLPERDIRSLESYLELQFNPATAESQLEKYNPLQKAEISLNWDGGGFATKNLGFNFQRVYGENDQIVSVLVTVDDITDTVRLENELNRANETRERQTNMIFELFNCDANELGLFLKQTEQSLDDINNTLEAANLSHEDEADGRSLVEDVFRKVHNIKGNASLMGLQSIVDIASTVEEKLASLRNQPRIKGDDLLTSIVELAYLRELLTEFDELRHNTLGKLNIKSEQTAQKAKLSTTQKLVQELQGLVNTIGQSEGKSASISAGNLDLSPLTVDAFGHTRDLLIQLVRNSMVHGIETPDLRKERNKWSEGSIQIISYDEDAENSPLGVASHVIGYRDDGSGLDAEEIAKRALELEIITEEEMKAMRNAEKSALVFDHRFSSVDLSNDHAGRGAGMGLVREKINKDLNGKMRMVYEPGEYLEFTFFLPAKSNVPA